MRRLAALLLLVSLCCLSVLAGCDRGPSQTERFAGLADRYLAALYAHDPVWATQLGFHAHDGALPDLSLGTLEAWADLNRAYLDSLGALDPRKLEIQDRIDRDILMLQIEAAIFSHDELREARWNPLRYNSGDAIYALLARDFAPLSQRLHSVAQRLEQIPALLETARVNLDNPPAVFTRTALNQNFGTINLVMDGLDRYLEAEPELRSRLARPRAEAIAALTLHGQWLEEELLPRSHGDFRLGDDLWRGKLRFSLASDLAPEAILHTAEQDLERTTIRMAELARGLYRERLGPQAPDPATLTRGELIAAVLGALAEDRPTSETIVAQARGDLARVTAFVRERDLVRVPDEPVEIIVMPEHQRGMWIAYCDSPGPLEPHLPTFYAIAPTPADWSPERTESFYREYNDYMLQDLTIHEAMPGHYLQINHANRFRGSTPVRAVFYSGTFVEGWATYAEELMVEAGWGGPAFELHQLKMCLRLIINAIIDQKIHTAGMTEDEAMALMMERGFQEEGEAAGKWIRACLTATQLSTYYVGNLEINAIRRDWQARKGDRYRHREFHDRLLAYGSPPPRYVRELLGLGAP
jgi:uncharacterized protein (DUF885 family)